jgi:hypothetical protein
MFAEQRKAVRRPVHLPAKIDAGQGSPMRDCTLVDISDLGARLAINHAENVPDVFAIFLSPFARPFRKCRLVWRKDEHVGVEFNADWHHRFVTELADPTDDDMPACPGTQR